MYKRFFILCMYLFQIFTAVLFTTLPVAGAETGLEARLQVLEDREAIRELLLEYGRTLDDRDFAAFSDLFARDIGEWDGGMGVAKGPAAIQKMMEDTIGKNTGGMASPNYHVFSNEVITVEGDTATAVSKWSFVVQGEDNRPEWVYLGNYHDKLVREDGRWKFLQRRVTGAIPGGNRGE